MEWTSRGARLFAASVTMFALAAAAVALRLISRGRILRVLGPTDWFILLTLATSLVNTVAIGIHVSHGLGHHILGLSWDEMRAFFMVMYGQVIVSNVSLALTKTSVLLLFLDVFVASWARRASYAVMALVAASGLGMALSNVFFCLPVHTFWDFAAPGRRCMDPATKYFVDASLNLALDFTMLVLPLPVIWPMTLPWRHKAWLYSVVLLGSFVCVVCALRFHFIDISIGGNDPTWSGTHIVFWSMMEINVSIIIACIPTLKPLVARLCPRLLETPRGSESDDTAGAPGALPTVSSPAGRPAGAQMARL